MAKRVVNFNAGPSTLPLAALEEAQAELLDFKGAGMSVMELSHRSPEYDAVHNEAVALVRELMGVSPPEPVSPELAGITTEVPSDDVIEDEPEEIDETDETDEADEEPAEQDEPQQKKRRRVRLKKS